MGLDDGKMLITHAPGWMAVQSQNFRSIPPTLSLLLMVSSARDSQHVTVDGKSLSMSAMDL